MSVEAVRSDAYPKSDVIREFAVGEEMYKWANLWSLQGYQVVLLGTFLYPFGLSVLHAASLLKADGRSATAILVPAGSDVWQIGDQLRRTTEGILKDPAVAGRVAYSRKFAGEISSLVGGELSFEIIRPCVDLDFFRPCSSRKKEFMRQKLGLQKDSFILVNCCNMRPVKELGLTLDIALSLALRIRQRVVLLLVGPITDHVVARIREVGALVRTSGYQELSIGNLQIALPEFQEDPRPYFWAADLAINTSLHDSFNISLAESMACGVPIVTSNVVGLAELEGIESAGLFFPVEGEGLGVLRTELGAVGVSIDASRTKILDWIEEHADSRTLALERSRAARKVVERHLGKETIAASWKSLLGRVSEGSFSEKLQEGGGWGVSQG